MEVLNQEYQLVELKRLKPHPQNPREGDVGAIHSSVQKNGFYGALIVQRSTGYILAGNHRFKVAQHDRASHVPVIWVDCDDEAALRILLADNRTADLASQNKDVLATLLASLAASPAGLDGTAYDTEDLDRLLRDVGQSDPFGELVQGEHLNAQVDFEVLVTVTTPEARDTLLTLLTQAGHQPTVRVQKRE